MIVDPHSWASTDQLDVKAVDDLFKALSYPSQLKGWRESGGDPCGESWTGVVCSESYGQNLKEMGLSHNNLSAYLPSSFGSLKNLIGLFLQNNEFTGLVIYMSELPLNQLDMSSNKIETKSSAIETYPCQKLNGHKKKKLSSGGLAFVICGGTLLANCTVLFITFCSNRLHEESGHGSLDTLPVSKPREHFSTAPEETPQVLPPVTSPSILAPRHLPHRRKCFPSVYILSELQAATNFFCEDNLLGEGYLGSVHKEEFPDGKVKQNCGDDQGKKEGGPILYEPTGGRTRSENSSKQEINNLQSMIIKLKNQEP